MRTTGNLAVLFALVLAACGGDAINVPDDFQIGATDTIVADPGTTCRLNILSIGSPASNGEMRGHVAGGPSAFRMQFADLPEPAPCTLADRVLACVWSGAAASGSSVHTWTIDIDDSAAAAFVTVVVDHEVDANDCTGTFDATLTATPTAN